MNITIIKKQFTLMGFERTMDFSKGFDAEMTQLRADLKLNLDKIDTKITPVRLVGFWQPGGVYFFGVAVTSANGAPSDFVGKLLPESEFALCRESRRGSAPKAEMYAQDGYEPNFEIAGDFEIFDDFDHLDEDDECDVLVPIKRTAQTAHT